MVMKGKPKKNIPRKKRLRTGETFLKKQTTITKGNY